MTREEYEQYAIENGLVVWSKEMSERAIKALEQEPSVEILKTEESNDNGTKYLNINVSDDEVKRNPDIVRLCSDVGILEYVKPQTDVLDKIRAEIEAEMNDLYRQKSIDQRTLTIIHACQRHIAIIDEYTKGESE